MAWLSTDYNFRKQITIAGTADGIQTNYQMKLVVYRSAGVDSGAAVYIGAAGCESDYDDLRFTKADGVTLLDYWIESSDASSATIWIEFDSLAASPTVTNFYIYYGYALATAVSNGANTFPFFDHFDVDKSKWTGDTAYMTLAASRLSFVSDGATWRAINGNVASATGSFAIRFKGNLPLSSSYLLGADSTTRTHFGYNIGDGAIRCLQSWDATAAAYVACNYTTGSEKTWDVIRNSGVNMRLLEDGVELGGSPFTSRPSTGVGTLGMQTQNVGAIIDLDFALMRNWTANEPTWSSWGAQETRFPVGMMSMCGCGM